MRLPLFAAQSNSPLRSPGRHPRKLSIELLEERSLLAVFSVQNVNESGTGSLNAAIRNANANPGLDFITFDLPCVGVHTIRPTPLFTLPIITDSIFIDGTTQCGWEPDKPVIELDGSQLSEGNGLEITSGGNTIKGLIVNNFPWDGIVFAEVNNPDPIGNNTVQGNFLGTDATGTVPRGNGFSGIHFVDSPSNTIGGTQPGEGNLLSGNEDCGVAFANQPSAGNRVVGNRIGTDITGMRIVGNGSGVCFGQASTPVQGMGFASDNFIGNLRTGDGNVIQSGGNIIAGNTFQGVFVLRGSGNVVQNNYIGIGLDGVTPLPNGEHGVVIEDGDSNVIGGTDERARNLISANMDVGVRIQAFRKSASLNRIQGNYIGTNKDGQFGAGLGNGDYGVQIINERDHDLGVATGNRIGGGDLADGQLDGEVRARNVISGNDIGVHLTGERVTGNFVEGNYIGTDAAGLSALGNRNDGVLISAPDNWIGGAAVGAGNVISGNRQSGIKLLGNDAHGNRLQGNLVGTDKTGAGRLGNLTHGVYFDFAHDNHLGGPNQGEGNTIAYNGVSPAGHGVVVASGNGNAIRHNSIFENRGRGIDLIGDPDKPDTFTLNDANGDPDVGGNQLQNYPVVLSVVPFGAGNVITWLLSSSASATFVVDFFANDEVDPSGFGEGKRFLRSQAVTTDANGDVRFTIPFLATDKFISATATDANGNTSEFSMVDTDGDALADAWETRGIDMDEDGFVDLTLEGATPDHKDLYVEVDAMAFLAPTQGDLDRVATAFGNAPVANPDGNMGIRLHAMLDEIIPHVFWTYDFDGDKVDALGGDRNANGMLDPGEEADPMDPTKPLPGDPDEKGGWIYFHATKEGYLGVGGFGSSVQRANRVVLDAKRLAFRYAIFADRYAHHPAAGGAVVGASGNSELPGNDFMVTLGAFRAPTSDDRALTFMHELGHTLNLRHGGSDDINDKPNYHSVMNYRWQLVEPSWMDEAIAGVDFNNNNNMTDITWRLDYSERAFPTLDERNLDENVGIGGHPGHWVRVGPNPLMIVQESGPVDWSRSDLDVNGIPDDDMGAFGNINDGSGLVLTGFDDWSNLRFSFIGTTGFARGAVPDVELEEMSAELFDERSSIGPGPGIMGLRVGQAVAYEDDGVVTVTVTRAFGTLGTVTVDFSTSDGTATGGADYEATSGTLTFADGEYRKTFNVVVHSDSLEEQTESIQLLLSNPTGGARLGPGSVQTIQLVDGNAPIPRPFLGSLQIEADTLNVNENAGVATVAVTRLGNTRGEITVDFATEDITATAGADYAAKSGTLTFADGEDRQTFTIQINNDLLKERRESIRLILTDPTEGAVLGTNAIALLNIIDDDALILLVNNVADAGPGSLRQAILEANIHPGLDFIHFNIDSGVQTIAPLTELPTISDPVELDGTTQPGFFDSPIIELDMSRGPLGLDIAASDTTIRGVVINGVRPAIRIIGSSLQRNVVIEGNYIGTDVTGMQRLGNGSEIHISEGDLHRIGGTTPSARNVISGGIRIEGPTRGNSILIQGNYIGVAADGVSPIAQGEAGILLRSAGGAIITVGGLEPIAGNIIAFYPYGIKTERGRSIVLSNSIHSNSLLGHSVGGGYLGWARVNHTDFRTDPGLNYPILGSAQSSDGRITISGYLNSRAEETFLLQFFSNTTAELSGFGQGKTLLGSAFVTTDSVGHSEFTITFDMLVPNRHLITATATGFAIAGTSEFSPRIAVGDLLGSVYTVNSIDDVDDGVADAEHTSLREAILAANNHPGPDEIRFNIGNGQKTIAPVTLALPAITDAVMIDGTTQPGFAGMPIIELIGTSIDTNHPSSNSPERLAGLRVFADNSTVRGLVINRFDDNPRFGGGTAIWLHGNGNAIEGNFIGTNLLGTQPLPNSIGIRIHGVGNRVGGKSPEARNLISGNHDHGIIARESDFGLNQLPASDTIIQGNFIGTDLSGTVALGNGRSSYAAVVLGQGVIGGSEPGAGNLVSGNRGGALVASGIIQGNLIGTDVTGTKIVANAGIGIVAGSFAQVGGTLAGEGNLVSNNLVGILLVGQNSIVRGNLVGTDITGSRDFGNREDGIVLDGAINNLIGGTSAAAGNIISGNDRHGILVTWFSGGNSIQGNLVGVQADGVSPLGNGSDGIAVGVHYGGQSPGIASARDNRIGGLENGAGNIVAHNAGHGITVIVGRRNLILSNSIFSNGGLGIDLDANGPTPNDAADDADEGGNDLVNFPVLTKVITDGTRILLEGTFNSTPHTAFDLQFFANPSPDPTGFGEGKTLLFSSSLVTDADGNATFLFVRTMDVSAGHFVTATATDSINNTSEFSAAGEVITGSIDVNRNPEAVDDQAFAERGGSVVITVLDNDNDPDGTLDPSTVTLTTPPSNGVATVDQLSGDITYTPEAHFVGTDTFKYTVQDNEGAVSNDALVVVIVCFAQFGDTNGDTVVDLADLDNVRNNFGSAGVRILGDATCDGRVNIDDLNAVRNNVGVGIPAALPRTSGEIVVSKNVSFMEFVNSDRKLARRPTIDTPSQNAHEHTNDSVSYVDIAVEQLTAISPSEQRGRPHMRSYRGHTLRSHTVSEKLFLSLYGRDGEFI